MRTTGYLAAVVSWIVFTIFIFGLLTMGDCDPASHDACEATRTQMQVVWLLIATVGLVCLIWAFLKGARNMRGKNGNY